MRPRRLLLPLLAGLTLLLTAPARAALFDDNEARRAILDLRAQVQQLSDDIKARQAAHDEQLNQLRRSLLDLNTQNEQLRKDLAALRGQQETLARDVGDAQRKQQELGQSLDQQRSAQSATVTLDGKTFTPDPEQRREFDAALGLVRAGNFVGAATAFNSFVQTHAESPYRESALFWLGNARYANREYKEAIWAFRAMASQFPDHPKTPEALLSIGNCYIEMKDKTAARRALDEVIKTHPDSEAALSAKERLASLK